MKRSGIVKAVSPKGEGRSAFTLTDAKKPDGTDLWFNGFGFAAEKGDTIEFDVEVNGIWHNFSNVKILAKGNASPQDSYQNSPAPQAPGQIPAQVPTQAPVPQPAPPVPNQPAVGVPNNQQLPESNISFIVLYGQKYKITMETCS